MSTFLSWYVIVLVAIIVVGSFWLIFWSSKPRPGEAAQGDTTGHTWDGLEEFNNPLPRWWLWMFYITLVFTVVYLLLFPGFGNFQGILGWSSQGRYEAEMERADKVYGPIFAAYAKLDIPELSKDAGALKVGQRLFINYCAQCHGSDAGGAKGFPSLSDNDWLYGSTPEAIKTSILNGRAGIMPPMAAAVGGDQGVQEVTHYVLSLGGRDHDAQLAAAGKPKFAVCAACHGMDGKGNQALGAPNLTDDIWLYGASKGAIAKTISEGRQGNMPAHKDFLGEDKVHLLAAYVYSLSQQPGN